MEYMPWWSQAQKRLADEAKTFTDEVLIPLGEKFSWKKEFPWLPDHVKEHMAKMGWFGARIPKKYGGRREEWGVTGACILLEETSRAAQAGFVLPGSFIAPVSQLLSHGTEEQKAKWLPRFAKGELIGSIVMTEPYAGSDVANIQTVAERKGDVYVVNGKKRFQTGAAAADVYMVFVRTSDSPEDIRRHKHLTGLLIEKGTPGFRVERVNDLMGIDGMYNCYLDFEEVRVPVSNRIGEENDGWRVMMHGLNEERALVAAGLLGPMREALRWAIYHLERRVQFGMLTGDMPTNQFKVADMLADLSLARISTYYTAYCVDIGREIPVEGSAAKLFCSEAALRIASKAIDLMGGNGVTRYYPVERIFRDAKLMQIAAGSNDILKLTMYRLGIASMRDDFKAPIRVIDPELGVPMPASKVSRKNVSNEDDVLKVLAENYRVNPGLHMTMQDIKFQLDISDEDLNKYLVALEKKGLASLYRDRRGAVKLAAATYKGLSRANPLEYYRHIPSWVYQKDIF